MLEEDSGFGGPVWSRSVETPYEEKGDSVLKASKLAVVAGELELSRVKVKHQEAFADILRDK